MVQPLVDKNADLLMRQGLLPEGSTAETGVNQPLTEHFCRHSSAICRARHPQKTSNMAGKSAV